MTRAILKKAEEESLALIELSSFSYLPGKGLVCSLDGEEIVVGTRALLADRHVEVNGSGTNRDPSSQIFIARNGLLLGTIHIADKIRMEPNLPLPA